MPRLRGEYIAKKENLFIVGNSGTGKTHLSTALAFAVCAQGRRVRFYTVTELVRQLLELREEKNLQRLLTHRGRILEANGQSYRLKQAKDLRNPNPRPRKEAAKKSAVEIPPQVG